MDTLTQIDNAFHQSSLLNWLDNSIISNLIILIFVLYANKLAPSLPYGVLQWFDNYIVKFIAFFLFVYTFSDHNAKIALISSIVLLLIVLVIDNWNKIAYFALEHPYFV